MSRTRMARVLVVGLFLAAVAAGSRPVNAGLAVVQQKARIDRADKQVLFSIVFNQTPDFTTVDAHGRPRDSFQYEIIPNVTGGFDQYPFDAVRTVIRGDEIGAGHVIPIRAGTQDGPDPNPKSGGWGVALGQVPFSLTGHTLSFDVPYKLMGTTDGNFSYLLLTTHYGATVSAIQGSSVPLPSAALLGAAGLCMLGALRYLTRHGPV